MSAPLRLILFDVDGTLVDSQGDIVAAMTTAFDGAGLPVPARAHILGIVGLSLDVAIVRLAPAADAALVAQMVANYKDAYVTLRAQTGAAQSSPLYPNARAVLDQLSARPENILGIATGKSRRGLDALLQSHGLTGVFATEQVSDHHPSKPHPAMIHAALSETGTDARDAVMIGDTSFDIEMGRAAGVATVAVTWGYHPVESLAQADHRIDDFADLPAVLDRIWSR